MALPNVTDITALSKCKRKERDVLMSCYDTLIGIDAIDSAKVVPKPAMQCWVTKFGLEKNHASHETLLESLTDTQKMEIVSDFEDAVGALMTIS